MSEGFPPTLVSNSFEDVLAAVRFRQAAERAAIETTLVTDLALRLLGASARTNLPEWLSQCVTLGGSAIGATSKENAARLTAAVDKVVAKPGPTPACFKLATGAEEEWVFARVEAVICEDAPIVLVFTFMHPNARQLPRVDALMSWFNLSATEAAVALALASGSDVAQIARSRSLSELTVRTHLRTIFEKTNTHAQRDLVALLMRLAPL